MNIPIVINNNKTFFVVFAISFVYLLHFLFQFQFFGSKYWDADQLLIADAANWYSNGIIPEPYFFGQNYLFLIEAYLAVPFIWSGKCRVGS